MLEVKHTKKYGRGVYATKALREGDLIESSPVIVLDVWESGRVVATLLNNYVFEWNDFKKSAIALGFGGLFNHSTKENVTYINNYQNKSIDFRATRDIKKGEQLFIDYGYDVKDGIRVTEKNKELAQKNEG
jgi:hypothetical protein